MRAGARARRRYRRDPRQPRLSGERSRAAARRGSAVKSGLSKAARSGTAGAESTRYLAISRDLARDIFGGKYPVGSLLPPETSLSEAYGASRQTIREAMRIIGGMGLIARQRGVGTTVLA